MPRYFTLNFNLFTELNWPLWQLQQVVQYTYTVPKNYNVKIGISEVYAVLVLQCTVSGR